MKKILALICFVAIFSLSAAEIKDPSTGAVFPTEISFSADGNNYELDTTGVATRKKFFVKVYSVASYLQKDGFPSGEAALADDQYAKQLSMKWSRYVDGQRVADGFKDSLNKIFSKEELAAVQADLDKFYEITSKDVQEGEETILRWIPGGTVEVYANGSKTGTIQNEAFAKGLWKVWFGKNSVVDRKDLTSKL